MRRLVKLQKNEKTANDGGGQSGAVAKDGSEVPEVGKAAEPESAGAVLANSNPDLFELVWPEVEEILKRFSDGGSDSGVRVFVPPAGRGLPASQ